MINIQLEIREYWNSKEAKEKINQNWGEQLVMCEQRSSEKKMMPICHSQKKREKRTRTRTWVINEFRTVEWKRADHYTFRQFLTHWRKFPFFSPYQKFHSCPNLPKNSHLPAPKCPANWFLTLVSSYIVCKNLDSHLGFFYSFPAHFLRSKLQQTEAMKGRRKTIRVNTADEISNFIVWNQKFLWDWRRFDGIFCDVG